MRYILQRVVSFSEHIVFGTVIYCKLWLLVTVSHCLFSVQYYIYASTISVNYEHNFILVNCKYSMKIFFIISICRCPYFRSLTTLDRNFLWIFEVLFCAINGLPFFVICDMIVIDLILQRKNINFNNRIFKHMCFEE